MFLDFPSAGFAEGVDFWRRVTGTSLSGPRGEFVTLVPPEGDAYLRAQRLGSGPARCHLDLHVDDVFAAASRAAELGAVVDLRGDEHVALTSPGGQAFCFVPEEGESTVPGPFEDARLDQVCIDIPPRLWDAECAFWRDVTGLPLDHVGNSEFARLRVPSSLPLKVLLQRLDDDAPAVRSHPDFATLRRSVLAPAHAAAGAHVGPANEQWTVMSDPQGRVYCLTGRRPG
ncbi:hypothetical protein JCM9957A_59730 [Kineosporia succinea]